MYDLLHKILSMEVIHDKEKIYSSILDSCIYLAAAYSGFPLESDCLLRFQNVDAEPLPL